MQGNKVQRPLSGGRAAGQTAPGAGVCRGMTAGSEQGAKSQKNPTRAGATYSQISPVSWAAEAGELRSGAAGKVEPLPATAGARQPPPAVPQRGAGPASPTCPHGSGSAPRRSAPHGPGPAPGRPLPHSRSRPAAPSASGRGQPGGQEPAAPPGGRRGWSGAERSRAGPPRSSLRAPGVTWRLREGRRRGSTARSPRASGGPGLGLRDLGVTEKGAFRAF